MADDLSSWTLQKAEPTEVTGWTLHPADALPKAPPEPGPSLLSSAAHAAGQGFTAGLGDEINGFTGAVMDKALGTPGTFADLYRHNRNALRREDDKAKAAHPLLSAGMETAASIPMTFVPGLGVAKGAGKLNALLKLGAQGGLAGLGASKSDSWAGDAENAAGGAALAMGAGGLGMAAGKGARALLGRVAGIDETVARKAAAEAADATNSARGEAGRAAQDAYKQLEHLRELGAVRKLSTEEAQVAAGLEEELGQKAREKLLPAAARKAETAAAYGQALQSEAQRAQDIAAKKLSGGELKQQLGARLLRYGLPAAGGALAGAMGLGGHGSIGGMGVGALAGAGLRPMMHSLVRMGSQPVVQRPLASGGASVLEALAPTLMRSGPATELQLHPDVAAQIAALRRNQEPDTSQWTLDGSTP